MIKMDARVALDTGTFYTALDELREKYGKHILEVAEVGTEYAKVNSPFREGHNRRSISLEVYRDGALVVFDGEQPSDLPAMVNGFRIYTTSGYGGWLEVGTEKMAAQPYIFPGFELAMSDLKQRLAGAANG